MTEKTIRKEIQNVLVKYKEEDRKRIKDILEIWVETDGRMIVQDKNKVYEAMSSEEVVKAFNLYESKYEKEELFKNLMEDMKVHMDPSRLEKACKAMRDGEVFSAVAMYRTRLDQQTGEKFSIGALWFSKAALALQDEEQTRKFAETVNAYYDAGHTAVPEKVMYNLAERFSNMPKETLARAVELFGEQAFVKTITNIGNEIYSEGRPGDKEQEEHIARMIGTLVAAVRLVDADESTSRKILELFASTYKRYSKEGIGATDSVEQATEQIRYGIIGAPKEILKDKRRLDLLLAKLNDGVERVSELHTGLILLGLARDSTEKEPKAAINQKMSNEMLQQLQRELKFASDFNQGDGERAIRASVPMSPRKFVEFEERIKMELAELSATDADTAKAVVYEYIVEGDSSQSGDTFGVLTFKNYNIYCYDEEFGKIEKEIKALWSEAVMNYAPEAVLLSLISPFSRAKRN